ncbi:MAG: NADH-quinone oxidoreductase subunit NuoF [Bacillota bacterium]
MVEKILICGGTGCISAGSREIKEKIEAVVNEKQLPYQVLFTGCRGFCEKGPLVSIEPEGWFYCSVKPDNVDELVGTLQNGQVYESLLYKDPNTKERAVTEKDIAFYKKQKRQVLRNCGHIDPENIEEYLAGGGYQALAKVLSMDRHKVIEEMKKSGLRGRGGGGFPTGIKWQITANTPQKFKYIICNADEGDPGAFMDRSILEGDPHAVLEGMLIAAYTVGAELGYIYVRAEYPLAVRRVEIAIEQARKNGYLGRDILGSAFNFDIMIKEGAGAFVCGEETALIESIEGNRGMPRPRPPFPATGGLWDKPTNINNVETLANVPIIFRMGTEEYSKIGTKTSKGTKVFALTGKVKNTGLVEVPMGITMKEIIFDIGGGIRGNKAFKAVQIGGPSGGCLPESQLNLPIDYDSLLEAGAMMGSGGLVVMDERTCMVEVSRFFLNFSQTESCGKCTPCREGCTRMLEILERIVDGKGAPEDLELLESLSRSIKDASLCGLGQSAPNPVLSTLRYFRGEYLAHIEQKYCPAGVCKNLVRFEVIPEECKGCGICAKFCPVQAIKGERKKPYEIDPEICSKCGICYEKCPVKAITRGARKEAAIVQ